MRRSQAINLAGAVATGIVLVLVLVTKFVHGAYIVVHRDAAAVPADACASAGTTTPSTRGRAAARRRRPAQPHPRGRPGRRSCTSRRCARSPSPGPSTPTTSTAVTVRVDPAETERLLAEWGARDIPVPLTSSKPVPRGHPAAARLRPRRSGGAARGTWSASSSPSTSSGTGGSSCCTTRARCGSRPGCCSSPGSWSPACRGSCASEPAAGTPRSAWRWRRSAPPVSKAAGRRRPARAAPAPAGFTRARPPPAAAGRRLLAAGLLALVAAPGPAGTSTTPSPCCCSCSCWSSPRAARRPPGRAARRGRRRAAANWFFTPPFGTLVVDSREQVVVLAGLPARGGRGELGRGPRRPAHAEAPAARAEAEALSGLAGAALAEQRTLTDVLGRVRQCSACARRPCSSGPTASEPSVERRRRRAPAHDERAARAGRQRLMLRVRGPELFAADRRVLASFADAAAGALQGRRLAARAAEAASSRRPTGCATALLAGRRPRPAHAARRRSRRRSAACGRRTSPGPPRSAPSCSATIETGADRLQGLVGNLLDAERLQAGVAAVARAGAGSTELVGAARCSAWAASTASTSTSRRTCPTCSPTSGCSSGCSPTCSRTRCGTRGRRGRRAVRGARGRPTASAATSSTTGPASGRGRLGRLFVPFQRLRRPTGDGPASGSGWRSPAASPRRWAARLRREPPPAAA